jgi:hypothetical protein
MLRVLYIGGCTRSGSTLVDRMLGQLPGFVSTGEFGLLTTHSLAENRLCGCGRRFRDCPYWQAVGTSAFGSWDAPEVRELVALHPQVTRQRHLVQLAAPRLFPGFSGRVSRYRELLARLYRGVATVTGAEVVVDSTKAPAYAVVLRGTPDIDLRILQLVRDSRGTAYSATKRQTMRDSVDRTVYKHRYAPTVIALRWVLYHTIFDLIARSGTPRLVARYEDVVRAPRNALPDIARFAGRTVGEEDLGFVSEGAVHFKEDHTAVGNDARLEHGTVALREDDAWRTRLAPRSRRAVTLLSWPLLKRWRYV